MYVPDYVRAKVNIIANDIGTVAELIPTAVTVTGIYAGKEKSTVREPGSFINTDWDCMSDFFLLFPQFRLCGLF